MFAPTHHLNSYVLGTMCKLMIASNALKNNQLKKKVEKKSENPFHVVVISFFFFLFAITLDRSEYEWQPKSI